MPEAPEIADRTNKFLFALGAQFPDLTVADLDIIEEPEAELLRAEWDGWIAWFPQSETAANQLAIMASVIPHLRGFLSPAVPVCEHSYTGNDWKRDWRAARQTEGRSLRPELIVEQNRERIVRDLGGFFHELHEFSVERARSLGAPSFREWREEHESLSRRALAILRPQLSWSQMTWARRWWSRFLEDDGIWKIEPSLVHGGISADVLLVDPLVQQLTAVTGWYGLRVADPAVDFAHLIDSYGTELGWRIVERYGELGSTADAALFRRIRLQQTVRRFRDVVDASQRNGDKSEALAEAIKRLR
jgi:aminoglycoside 2''-phosphotransferase